MINVLLQVTIALGPSLFNVDNTKADIVFKSNIASTPKLYISDINYNNMQVYNDLNTQPVLYHAFQPQNLSSNTLYQYAMELSPGNFTQLYYFVTPDPLHVRFGVWGDNQLGSQVFNQIVSQMIQREAFYWLGIGDYIQNETYESSWISDFYNPTSPWLPYIPKIGTRGNHDGEDSLAKSHWITPGINNEWGAITVGLCRILVLNSNIDRLHLWNTMDPGGAQYVFAQNEVNSLEWKNADYRLVLFHHPHRTEQWDGGCYYGTNGTYTVINTLVTNVLVPGGADIIFNGHSHSYQRGQLGTYAYHVISGGGGGWLDQNLCWDWPHITINAGQGNQFNHYLIIDVTPTRLEFSCVKLSGIVYDTFTIAPRRLP